MKKFRPCDWHGVWCLLLLLYTPVLHTSITFLDCPALSSGAGSGNSDNTSGDPFTPYWYINGNIKCFQDPAHAPLGLFALFVLICCITLIPVVMLIATRKLTQPYWVHTLVVPLTYPYKEKYAWWCGVELGKRVVLVFFAILFKKNDFAVLLSLVVILTVNGFFKPFKKMLVNILDLVYAVDVFILLSLRNTVDIEDDLQVIPVQSGEGDRRQDCSDVEGYTPFVVLLAVFYFLPVLVALVALGVWSCRLVYSLMRQQDCILMVMKKNGSESITSSQEEEEFAAMSSRTRTQTVVDVSEYEAPKQKPIIRLASKKKIRLGGGHSSGTTSSGTTNDKKTSDIVAMEEMSSNQENAVHDDDIKDNNPLVTTSFETESSSSENSHSEV